MSASPPQLDFCSDHFPVAMSYESDTLSLPLVSFNILNPRYKRYLKLNQGLEHSKLYTMPLAERYGKVLTIVQDAFDSDVAIVCLQEVSGDFLFTLEKWLLKKPTLRLLKAGTWDLDTNDWGLMLYDSTKVTVSGCPEIVPFTLPDPAKEANTWTESSDSKDYIFSNYMQIVTFVPVSSTASEPFTVLNCHVKFGQIDQLIQCMRTLEKRDFKNLIACGDFNVGVGFKDPRPESDSTPLTNAKEFILHLNHAQDSHFNCFQEYDLFDHFYTSKNVVMKTQLPLVSLLRKALKR